MDSATEASPVGNDKASATKAKRRVDSRGRTCPPNTYLRDSKAGPVYYCKIKVGRLTVDTSTQILERDKGSRAAAIKWVDAKRAELEQLSGAEAQIQRNNETQPLSTHPRSVASVTKLELNRFTRHYAGSPHVPVIEMHLARCVAYFGPETDVTTITVDDINGYIAWRRATPTSRREGKPTYGTIYRELATFNRGVRLANERHIFDPPFVLPISRDERKLYLRKDTVNEKQRSHQRPHPQCLSWIEAAKGTKAEHYTYLAYKTGMRWGELRALQFSWVKVIDVKHAYAMIVLPEWLYDASNKVDDRPIPLTRELYDYLAALAKDQPHDAPLLPMFQHVAQVQEQIRRRGGFEQRISLRDLRASFGRFILERTGNIYVVMRAMRHRDIKTTLRHYTRTNEDDMAAIAAAMGV